MDNSNIHPNLIDPMAKNFLFNTLQKCHDNRVKIYTWALNIGVLVVFVCIFGIVLYYSYKSKPTEYELQQKLMRDQQYILSKIRYYQGMKQEQQASNITSLPMMERY